MRTSFSGACDPGPTESAGDQENGKDKGKGAHRDKSESMTGRKPLRYLAALRIRGLGGKFVEFMIIYLTKVPYEG
ncbi:MAG TPA: hypothetical protein VFB76_02845 [Candidatus Angelobacter sp.]|nr:hypothetical protein [Candidatus Angelobacter sp.]